MNCILQDHCGLHRAGEVCSEFCVKGKMLKDLMERSNLPLDRQKIEAMYPDDVDYEAFTRLKFIRESIVEFVYAGENLLIYGSNTGNGKTSWSVKLLISYFNKIAQKSFKQTRGVFVNVPTYFSDLKRNINSPRQEFEQLTNNLRNADLVVWDDLCIGPMSDYELGTLLPIIDERLNSSLSNIVTSNFSLTNIEKMTDSRLASRLSLGIQIELKGHDRRRETRDRFADFKQSIENKKH